MSIQTSSIYTDYANEVKNNWLEDLKKARFHEDWNRVDDLINLIENFHFDE